VALSTHGRRAVRLTDEEIETFLAGHRKVQVATVGPDGAPHLTTLFYAVDEGRIAFWTYGASQKIVNLRRDSRITCLVEDGEDYFELRGVSIRGRATLVEDYDAVRALGTKVVAAMLGGADAGETGEALVAQQARKRVGVLVEPEHVASWDHSKMTGVPGGSSSRQG
jgi:PPOX class probable F420-dependent enzyme